MSDKLYCCLLLCCLSACGSAPRAPIEDRNSPAARHNPPVYRSSQAPAPGTYRVQRGDTLYSIAWRNGIDFRALAAANGIAAPYTIYPGQLLQLKAGAVAAAPAPAPASASRSTASRSVPPAGKAPPRPPVTQPSPASGKKVIAVDASPPPAPSPPQKAVGAWRWPASGPLVRRYSSTVHKGIDIGGNRGEPVVAVADGVVVYAGTGIAGFGELLIVKHNDTYLSAYGHNDRLLAKEGQSVKSGQKIAEKGSSGTDTVKLHFEIRRNGKPVDPLQLLPRH
ncbi:peptidoglycan DD-metalloendopeptidase family protein [Parahaliea mediterranea]|uniref:peptidoglycan DD-metalloendopeptidase family protein n=1 Tax=Parahaliea mediterranea TaxID=651086 RepID=UPI0019D44FB1|nr:peptidoglycan DD-metalloendopeptidase family protein [Parahaliea mediterranea]